MSAPARSVSAFSEVSTYLLQYTKRDHELMAFVRENGFVLFEQLLDCGFPSASALKKRLCLLHKGGLLRSRRVSQFPKLQSMLRQVAGEGAPQAARAFGQKRVYFINPELMRKESRREFAFPEELVRHQVGLGYLRQFLVEECRPECVLNEQHYLLQFPERKRKSVSLVPDLVVIKGDLKLAVEYERTQKDRATYYSRWHEVDRSEFSHCLYVCESEALCEKLKGYGALSERLGFTHVGDKKRVFKPGLGYVSLEQFLALNLR